MKPTGVCVAVLLTLPGSATGQIDFSAFHTPAQVNAEMGNLVTRFPGLVQQVQVGSTIDGHPISALRVSGPTASGDVIIVALHHAREWIATEVALYIAEHLLTRRATDPQLSQDMSNLNIWIVPVVNPDGYAYTESSDRYWRKNRRDNGDGTFGVDLNRNWGYQWGLSSGSSGLTYSDTYRGSAPFSEPETQALRDLVNSVGNLKALVTYHSYSELYLRPWAYVTDDPPGESTLKSLAQRSIAVIAAVHGHTYQEEIWYTSSGETTDYLWGERRVAAFTPELRPTCCGLTGFSPAASEIIPTAEENFPPVLALVHDAGAREVWIRDYPGDNGDEPSAVWTAGGWSHAFWVSPDIWTVPSELSEGTTVTLNVHVLNNTTASVMGVEVSAYWNDPRISLEFPALNSNPIGTQTVDVPPGGITITMPWTVPIGTNSWGERHWCVGVVLKSAHDMPLTNQAQRSSNIAIRNFNTTTVATSQTLFVAAENFLNVPAELRVVVDTTRLPAGWRVFVPFPPRTPEPQRERPVTGLERKARLLGVRGPILMAGQTILIAVRVEVPNAAPDGATADIDVHGALLPLVPGERGAIGNGYTYRVVVRRRP